MVRKPKTRIYKNRWFAKYASLEGISDAAMTQAQIEVNADAQDL